MARAWSRTVRSVTVKPFDRAGAFVGIIGDFDIFDEALLRDGVGSAIKAGYTQLVIDFSAATFLDAGAYRILLEALEPLQEGDDSDVMLVGLDGCAARSLEILEVDRRFDCYRDRAMARRALGLSAPETAWR
jgi:anti-anti-sigma regulatory factor